MDANQLAQIEALCLAVYEGHDQNQRQEAQQQLLTLQSSADFIPQCQMILDNSSQPFAQVVAAQSLETLVTTYWSNFALPQKLDLKNYVLNYLATHATMIQDFVLNQIAKLACRITKLGWLESSEFREIVDEIRKFLDSNSPSYQLVGLKLLTCLVTDMNTMMTSRPLTMHRKVSVAFRDSAMIPIFEVAIIRIRTVHALLVAGGSNTSGGATSGSGTQLARMSTLPLEERKLAELSLKLVLSCLSYDYLGGGGGDENSDDVSTLQLPVSWKPMVRDVSLITLFFDMYQACDPPSSNVAMEILTQWTSVRRTVFPSENDRLMFLQLLLNGLTNVMKNKIGFTHEENFHEFCRLLGRIKSSFQLIEMVKVNGFGAWLTCSCDFSIQSLASWQQSMNSIQYVLALWGRMVSAVPYIRVEADMSGVIQLLRDCAFSVIEAYIKTMLDSVAVVVASDGGVDDPLEDETSLREQMDKLPLIARQRYDDVAQFLLSTFEQSLQLYQTATAANSAVSKKERCVVEGRLTWLVYMVSAVMDGAQTSDSRKVGNEMLWDGRLSRCCLQLVQLLEFNTSNGQSLPDEKLELALLTFFRAFRRGYIVESFSSTHPTTSSVSVPSGSPAHPLLAVVLNGGSTSSNTTEKEVSNIFGVMQMGSSTEIMNLVVRKLCSNIKYWHRCDKVLEDTLELFVELVVNYSYGKTLLGLDAVQFLVYNHVGEHFPFLGYDSDNKYRIQFYSALTRLVFTSSEDINNAFDTFVAPNLAIFTQLSAMENLRQPAVRTAIIAALRDMRGICTVAYNKRTYNLLFDALYPAFFPFFRRVAETWYDDPSTMIALLKFLQEFVFNRSQRIAFDNSSANGILLFRETSAILCTYAKHILTVPVRVNIYLEKYKGIRVMLNTLSNAFSGNYVNFGVFGLYNDPALQNVMDVALQMCLQIPLSDVLVYPKLAKAFFTFLELLFASHLDVLSGLESPVFIQLVKTAMEGLQNPEVAILAGCTIDHVATFLFLNHNRDKPSVVRVRQHIATEPDIFNNIITALFNIVLFGNNSTLWAVTRPILSIMLASEASFTDFQNQLIASQPPELHERLHAEFAKLTTDVQRSLESSNRDRFTQKVTVFRINVRQILTW